jgi:hypothetical protein
MPPKLKQVANKHFLIQIRHCLSKRLRDNLITKAITIINKKPLDKGRECNEI